MTIAVTSTSSTKTAPSPPYQQSHGLHNGHVEVELCFLSSSVGRKYLFLMRWRCFYPPAAGNNARFTVRLQLKPFHCFHLLRRGEIQALIALRLQLYRQARETLSKSFQSGRIASWESVRESLVLRVLSRPLVCEQSVLMDHTRTVFILQSFVSAFNAKLTSPGISLKRVAGWFKDAL